MDIIIEILEDLYYGIPVPLRVAYFLWIVFLSLYWYASKHDEYNSKILNVEKEEKVNFNFLFQSIGISIVAVNQILLWSHINPNDLINTNVSQATQPLGEIAIEVKNKYSDQYETFINYILPALGLLVMYWGLKMAALARAVINGYWNPNIVVFKDKKFQELKTNGIYSKIRHPIYLAQVLLALGTAIAGTSWLLLLFPIILAIINFKRAKNEDKELERIFGNEFLNCKDRVSACGLGTR